MNTNRKIYPDVFQCDVLVSIKEKKRLSLTMLDKINYFVDEISKKKRNNPFVLVQFEILCAVFAWCVQIVVQNFMEIWEFLNVFEK